MHEHFQESSLADPSGYKTSLKRQIAATLPPNKAVLDLAELVAATGVSKGTIYAQIAEGKLVPTRLGTKTRFAIVDVVDWICAARQAEVQP